MPVKKAAVSEINFGDMGFYVAGGGLPEGNYALEFAVQMYQAKKQSGEAAGPERLGVMVTAHSLTDLSAEPKTQFYSMGSKAHEHFAPNPDTGKGLVQVAGSTGASSLNQSTNWALFLKAMYDCGLPPGVFTNDLSVLDGVHVHLHPVPEPEDRKGFVGSKTSEVEQGTARKANTIAVVSEILDGGCPWEGGGGIPEKGAAPAKPAAAKPVAKVAPKAAAKPAPAPAPEPEGGDEEALMEAAVQGVTTVLEANPDGCAKLALRTNTFKAVQKAYDDETAQNVLNTFFSSDDALDTVLNPLGYKMEKGKVVVA